MPLDIVWFQLPNMSIYFNQLLALALVFYIIYFFAQRLILDCNIKDNIPDNKIFWINRCLGILRLIPIIIIVFSMYNIDNVDIDDVLRYNRCVNDNYLNYSLPTQIATCKQLIYGIDFSNTTNFMNITEKP